MDSADPQNRSEWRGPLRGRLVKKPNPRKRKTGSKTDMMMMMMMLGRQKGSIFVKMFKNLLLRNHIWDEAETWHTCLGH